MRTLRLRKKTLLLESDLNRLTLQAHYEHLRKAGSWTSRVKGLQQPIAPWVLILAPLAGLALALGLRRSASGGSFLARALAFAPSVINLWRTCAAPRDNSK